MQPFSQPQIASRLSQILSEQQAAALEQVERILEERFMEIARQVGAELEAVLDAARGGLAGPGRQSAQGQAASRPTEKTVAPSGDAALHMRARRLARVKVAEMRLYQARAVARGRAGRNLYAELRNEIDSARQQFQREFFSAGPSMVDYLHQELVRTLANDDEALLGEDYPGPLV
jgi:hypothetical protein